MENKDELDKKIINQIKDFLSRLDSLLSNMEISKIEISEYFLINTTWLEKYLSLLDKENIFKDLIYSILENIPLSPYKYIYHHNQDKYIYINNLKIIPKDTLSHLLLIKNKNKSEKNHKIYNLSKVILISSKIVIVFESELCLEVLDKNFKPEYLLCFNKNENITLEQIIDVSIKELKLNIPLNEHNNIIYDYESNNKIKITIINLSLILEEQKKEKNELIQDNCNKMDQLWLNKYKFKLNDHINTINNKYNLYFQNQLNLNTEILKENFKNQKIEQNKKFNENYNNVINKINNKINNKKENNDVEIINHNKEKQLSLISNDYIAKNNDKEKNETKGNQNEIVNDNNNFDDFLIIDDKDINPNSYKSLNKKRLNLIIAPVLFFLSKIDYLIEFFKENKEQINLYKFIEEENNTLSEKLLNFYEEVEEEKNNQKNIYIKYSDLLLNIIITKIKDKLYKLNSPGEILSVILENLDIENKFLIEEQSTIVLMNNKENYNIYNDQEMLQMFINKTSTSKKSLVYEKFYNILKNTKLCKECNKRSYEYQTSPILNIYLNKDKSIVHETHSDFEISNALLCRVCFPQDITQLLSPSYLKKKTEYCKNCDKYNEVIYNKYIFALKEFLIINIDRDNDPKNDMIFIYPEKLDLKKESHCILNLYELTGVICKQIRKNNYNINDVENDISYYICYMKNKENKWICFDANYNIFELKSHSDIFNFNGVSVLLYSKIEDK